MAPGLSLRCPALTALAQADAHVRATARRQRGGHPDAGVAASRRESGRYETGTGAGCVVALRLSLYHSAANRAPSRSGTFGAKPRTSRARLIE